MRKTKSPFSQGTLSLWADTVNMPSGSQVTKNIETDVCVIGAGIGGLTTAYLLMKEGYKVCVVESLGIGEGQTGQTTAHFTYALDDRYYELERLHGEKGIRLAANSHKAAISQVEAIVQSENISCDMTRLTGYLFTSPEDSIEILTKELDAIHRAGLNEVYTLPKAPLKVFDTGMCLAFPNQLQLHPLKYLKGLATALLKGDGEIYTGTHVIEFEGGPGAHVKTQYGKTIRAKHIVVATNTPVNNRFAIHTKQAAYRSYVIGYKVPKGLVDLGLYWDTEDPYHYVRLQPHSDRYDVLVVGGEDHKTGQELDPEKCFKKLNQWARHYFPIALESVYEWSGQVMEPVDGLAFLGHNPLDRDNVYIITGDSGNGMTHCTIGALLICDQIQGRKNPWEDLYNPSRVTLKALPEFSKENANTALQYKDWFSPASDPLSIQELFPGEGTVVSRGLEKIAVYKKNDGTLETHSAVCPHLKGIVRWNTVEKSWDCPAHGSRFDCHGRVIEGPALCSLEPLDFNPIKEKERNDMAIRRFTLIAGWTFLLVGLLGFVPAFTSFPAMTDPDLRIDAGHGRLFGLFPVNVVHNLIHIAFGVWALAAYKNLVTARNFNRATAVIYAVMTIAGFIPNLDTMFGIVPLHSHDIWLHALITLTTGYFGFVHKEKALADSTNLHSLNRSQESDFTRERKTNVR